MQLALFLRFYDVQLREEAVVSRPSWQLVRVLLPRHRKVQNRLGGWIQGLVTRAD
jgi:hypothetical protein